MQHAGDFPKIGEHHPDGPAAVSTDHRRQSDTLNFGWFSLPQAKKGSLPHEDQAKISTEVGELHDNRNCFESNQRPLSKDQHRPDSQQRATPQPCASSTSCPWPENQIPGPQHCLSQADNVHPEPGTNNQFNKSAYDENLIVEWPLSIIARENMPKPTCTPSQPSRTPLGRPEMREVPPMPLPPLQWQGYHSSSRPTYSSWRDNWYQSRDVVPTITRGNGTDTNNNSKRHGNDTVSMDSGKSTASKNRNNNTGQKKYSKPTTKNRGKNTNNNNETGEFLTIYSNNQLIAWNYSADRNNNNWMIVDDNGPSVKTQVTTIPPYEQSSETVPSFYNPSVVMQWEDTEDQTNSTQASLMKRIRSSFFQMWSVLSCLKNQEDQPTTPSCRPFKYDRFDYNNLRSNEQGTRV